MPALESEGGVTLEQEFSLRSGIARFKGRGWNRPAIGEPAFPGRHRSANLVCTILVFVIELTEAVRQTECAGPKRNAQPIGKPFGEEEDARFAVMAHVSAEIQKTVRSDRLEEPFPDSAADSRTHSEQGKGNDADKRTSVAEIELERNLSLQECWVGFVVNEDGPVPGGEKQRFARLCQQPALACFVWLDGGGRYRHLAKLLGHAHHSKRPVPQLRQF